MIVLLQILSLLRQFSSFWIMCWNWSDIWWKSTWKKSQPKKDLDEYWLVDYAWNFTYYYLLRDQSKYLLVTNKAGVWKIFSNPIQKKFYFFIDQIIQIFLHLTYLFLSFTNILPYMMYDLIFKTNFISKKPECYLLWYAISYLFQ